MIDEASTPKRKWRRLLLRLGVGCRGGIRRPVNYPYRPHHPGMFSRITIDYYGTPITQLASINVPEAASR